MKSDTVKNAVLAYYRFDRKYPYVATECLNCDVLASNGMTTVEVEVKTCWADYKREFKKRKHSEKYIALRNKARQNPVEMFRDFYDPNMRFFAAPYGLAEKIAQDEDAVSRGYGVISVDEQGTALMIKRARRMHNMCPPNHTLHAIVQRMSSELITIRQQVRN